MRRKLIDELFEQWVAEEIKKIANYSLNLVGCI
jgi:hypothetical protein